MVSRHAGRRAWIPRLLYGALLPAICLAPAFAAQARHARAAAANEAPPDGMAVQIKSDRLTLAVAKVPQVYLAGPIDVGAPQRFEALLKAGRIPAGSDIYLDSQGGDLAAGMALGRLFRGGALSTHLGAWRAPGTPPKAARCMDACVYAYLGGLYRWAPAGMDRIGVHEANLPAMGATTAGRSPLADSLVAYLQAMRIRLDYLAKVLAPASDGIVWLKADQMFPWLVANNGRQPLEASYQAAPGGPQLVLSQVVRGGENRMALACTPTGLMLTASYGVGDEHARKLAARGMRSSLEIERQEVEVPAPEPPRVVGDAVVFRRPLSLAQLGNLLAADTAGAWTTDRSGLRYGFTMHPAATWHDTRRFYGDCVQVLERQARRAN